MIRLETCNVLTLFLLSWFKWTVKYSIFIGIDPATPKKKQQKKNERSTRDH